MSKKKRYWIQPPPKIKQTRHSNPSMGPQWVVEAILQTMEESNWNEFKTN